MRALLLVPLLWAVMLGFVVLGAGRAFAANGPSAPEAELVICDIGDGSSVARTTAESSVADGESCEDGLIAGQAAEAGDTVADSSSSDAARAAPLCGNGAVSIAAVTEVPEVDRGRIEPAPCDVERLLALLRSDHRRGGANFVAGGDGERPERQPVRVRAERFDAACTSELSWPLHAGPSLVASAEPRGLGWQPGYGTRVERPPSGR